MNVVDPQSWIAAILIAIVNGHLQSQTDELLLWNHIVRV